MSDRVALYLRFSSAELQSETSLDGQRIVCVDYVKRNGWTVVAEYQDAGISGASLRRPGIKALLADARAGKFDIVVAQEMSRLSRDQEDTAHIHKNLKFAQVRINTISEGWVGAIEVAMRGYTNSSFLTTLGENVLRGQRLNAERGKNPGGRHYGYVSDKQVIKDQFFLGEMKIVPEQAEIVRRIFRDYCDGKSPHKICSDLNKEGIPAPSGGEWTYQALNGSSRYAGVLRQRLYIGELHWNKSTTASDPTNGKRVTRTRAEGEHVVTAVPHLRIMDDELFFAVQRKRAALTAKGGPRQQVRPVYLLSGLVKCSKCQGNYVVHGRDHMNCNTYKMKGTCSNRRMIRIDALEKKVVGLLKDRLMNEALVSKFIEKYEPFLHEVRLGCNAERERNEAELAQTSHAMQNLIEVAKAVAKGGNHDIAMISDEIRTLGERKQTLVGLIKDASDAPIIFQPDMAEVYARGMEEVTARLRDPVGRDKAVGIIRRLIKEVVLTPSGDGLTVAIEVRGSISGILTMAAARNRKSNSKPDYAEEFLPASQIEQIERLVQNRGFETGLMPPPTKAVDYGRSNCQMTVEPVSRLHPKFTHIEQTW